MEIILEHGNIAIIDDCDYDIISQFKWHVTVRNKICYALANAVTCDNQKTRKRMYMHRVILGDIKKPLMVDHINGNGLDNRRCNLRIVTHRENLLNMHKSSKSSKYPGIYYNRCYRKWDARIYYNRKSQLIGLSKSEEDAFTMYRVACKHLVGIDVSSSVDSNQLPTG